MGARREITIIGNGKMGQALARQFARRDREVQLLGRTRDKIAGKIVVLALPFDKMEEMIDQYKEDLQDKIVIDVSNPMDYQTRASFLPAGMSMSLFLAERFPDLIFLKAFNTNFSSSRVEAKEEPVLLYCGDDSSAKSVFSDTMTDLGFAAIDIGPLNKSSDLEAFARIQVALLEAGKKQLLQEFSL